MFLKEIFKEISEESSLSHYEFDENGVCHLLLNDKYIVHFEDVQDREIVYIFSKLRGLPGGDKALLFEALLEGNLFGKGTGGSVLSIDIGTQSIVLFRELSASVLNLKLFEKEVSLFVDVIVHWNKILDEMPSVSHSVGALHDSSFHKDLKSHHPDLHSAIQNSPSSWLKV